MVVLVFKKGHFNDRPSARSTSPAVQNRALLPA